MPFNIYFFFGMHTEYDAMNLDMLREVIPMLKQQLEKAQIDRNYVQLERVSSSASSRVVVVLLVPY